MGSHVVGRHVRARSAAKVAGCVGPAHTPLPANTPLSRHTQHHTMKPTAAAKLLHTHHCPTLPHLSQPAQPPHPPVVLLPNFCTKPSPMWFSPHHRLYRSPAVDTLHVSPCSKNSTQTGASCRRLFMLLNIGLLSCPHFAKGLPQGLPRNAWCNSLLHPTCLVPRPSLPAALPAFPLTLCPLPPDKEQTAGQQPACLVPRPSLKFSSHLSPHSSLAPPRCMRSAHLSVHLMQPPDRDVVRGARGETAPPVHAGSARQQAEGSYCACTQVGGRRRDSGRQRS